MEGTERTVGKLPTWSLEVPGRAQDAPKAQRSLVQGTVEVLNLFSAEAQFHTEYLPNLLHLFARFLSLFIVTSEAVMCTQGIRRGATAAAPRASAKIQVLSLLVWDRPSPNPLMLPALLQMALPGSERRRAICVSEHGVE